MSGPADLDLYDIAYLAGGTDRVVDTALVVLVESGRIRVHAPGELAVEEQTRRHPVEAAVMDAVGTHGHRSIDTVRWRLTGDARLAELGRSLAAAGLLKRRSSLGRRSTSAEWTTTPAGREALRQVTDQPPAPPRARRGQRAPGGPARPEVDAGRRPARVDLRAPVADARAAGAWRRGTAAPAGRAGRRPDGGCVRDPERHRAGGRYRVRRR
jgi:hypothetical protein